MITTVRFTDVVEYVDVVGENRDYSLQIRTYRTTLVVDGLDMDELKLIQKTIEDYIREQGEW